MLTFKSKIKFQEGRSTNTNCFLKFKSGTIGSSYVELDADSAVELSAGLELKLALDKLRRLYNFSILSIGLQVDVIHIFYRFSENIR